MSQSASFILVFMKLCVCALYIGIQIVDLITIEDNSVHDCQLVHGWKACAKPVEVVPQKFKYKQKKDNRGSTIEGVYTLRCACDIDVLGTKL